MRVPATSFRLLRIFFHVLVGLTRQLLHRVHAAVFHGVLATLVTVTSIVSPAAFAADTVIGFDNLSAGTEISTQFHDQGVDLDTKLGGGRFQFPVVAMDAVSFSSPNVLDISRGYPVEFPGAYLNGRFTNPHHHSVGVWVHGRGFPGAPATGTTTLTVYDLNGKVVATATAVAPPPTGAFILLNAVSANSDVARFDVSCNNDLLDLDDLTFDALVEGPKPDFAVFATGVQIALGAAASTTAMVRRFDGSSGDVSLAVSNLPVGVIVSQAVPNPVTGPDGSTSIITLIANASATPVQDWPLTLTGTPSASAGQYGPHSSNFPLTILDGYDAQIVSIEVTQGIQPYNLPAGSSGNQPLHGVPVRYNGVVLAGGGKTVARVFPDYALFPEHSPPPDFYCTLVGSRNGVSLPGSPLVAATGRGGVILGPNFVTDTMRAQPNGVCNFVLPAEWTHGTLTLTASINAVPLLGPPVAFDCCSDNDTFTLTDIPFAPTRDLFFVPFALRVNHGFLGFPDDVFEEARNLLPIADNQFHMGYYSGEIDITDIWNQDVKACGFLGTGSCPEDSTGRGASVAARLRDIADDLNFTESGELVVGIYPQTDPVSTLSDRIRSLESVACTGPFWDCDELSVIAVQNQLRPMTSVAHELGHMLGRAHASFACGAGDVDNNGAAERWPPDERGFLDSVGVDRRDFSVRFPDRSGGNLGGPFYDFMSYCANGNDANDPDAWISEKGWLESLQAVVTGAPGSGAVLASSAHPAIEPDTAPKIPVLVVQAFVDNQGNAYITKIAADRRHAKSPPSSSPYHLVVLGRSGETLSDTGMAVATGYVHQIGAMKFLSVQVPVTGAEAVEIRTDGKLIARRVRSRHEPKVSNVRVRPDVIRDDPDYKRTCDDDDRDAYRDANRDDRKRHYCDDDDVRRVTVVSWQTQHARDTALNVKLDYSTDGGKNWRPVFFGPDRQRVELSTAVLTGSHDGRVRVRVSDGFNETAAVSERFREAGAPPIVRITSPKPGAVIKKGESLYLSASAYDDRHEIINGDRLYWYAGSRPLGTGQAISVSSLDVGIISIRLLARGSDGRTTKRSVAVQVTPLTVRPPAATVGKS